ncbi:MAG: hypothetical protein AAFR24_14565 [Cyanobacteria bacterium J06627_3]
MKTSKISPLYAETRVLLGLNAHEEGEVSPSNFVPKGNAHYKQALIRLTEEGCLSEIPNGKRYKKYSLTSQGRQRLIENLSNEEFTFFSNLGAKTTNGLLKVFRQSISGGNAVANGSVNVAQNGNGHSIASYESFSNVALDVYAQLNEDFQCEDLVPIYRIRRTIGEQVSRAQFNEWLLEMQANDKLQLIGGAIPDLTPDQAEDSITTSLGGIRYYAKRLST